MPKISVERLEKAEKIVREWGTWATTAVLVIFFVLEFFKIEDVPIELAVVGVSVAIALSRLLESNEKLDQAIEKNLIASEKITAAVMPQLYSLEECLKDLTARVRSLPRMDELTVRHVGLDMSDAWSDVKRMLRDPYQQMNVNYQLVMITSEYTKLGEVDEEILKWSEYVGTHALRNIKKDVPLIGKEFSVVARRLKFEAKEYIYSPFVHGFEVQGPVNICYMALCRWKSEGDKFEFDWGDRTYFRIIKETADPIQIELYRVFASTFERHWGINPVLSFAFDSNAHSQAG